MGELTNDTRIILFKSYAPRPGFYIKGKLKFHFELSNLRETAAVANYRDVMARSRFSVCPRGFGPGTIRFWESLSYGAIPVLICDGSLLPAIWNWSDTVIKISEKEFKQNPDILGQALDAISLEREAVLRDNCIKAFSHCYDKNVLSSYIEQAISLHPDHSAERIQHLPLPAVLHIPEQVDN